MVLLLIVVLFMIATGGLYSGLRSRAGSATFWRTAVSIGLSIGILRAVLASIGWYTVEHTGGALQVPGFALALLAWPEGGLLPTSRVSPAPPHFYVLLSLLLIGSSILFVVIIASVARPSRRTRPDIE